jgi:TRAP-type C4-dicarboxylate transport system substrate-binding protein
MARKEDNLVKGDEAHKLTAEEQSMGGKASAQARRKKRDLREALEILLDKEYTDKKTGGTMQGIEVVTAALFKEAAKGNVKAFNTLRDTIGQQVVQKVMIAEVDADVIAEVEAIVEQSE